MYFVYILLCKNNSFYTGFTDNLKRRLQQHQRNEVKYTSNLTPKISLLRKNLIKRRGNAKRKTN